MTVQTPKSSPGYGDIILDDVTDLWYDEGGRLHVQFSENMVFHFSGTKTETVAGDSVEFVKGNKTEISTKEHHVNPTGFRLFKKLISKGETTSQKEILPLMIAREKRYRENRERFDRREFYIRAAFNNMKGRRPKKRGCGCG
jgi:hypothetical protein